MRVLHVIPSLAIQDGGPPRAMAAIAKALHRVPVDVTILTTSADNGEHRDAVRIIEPVEVVSVRRNVRAYKIGWSAISWLSKNVERFDVVHIHAVFSFLSTAAALMAGRRNVPYIVRPLGVLNRWGMRKRRPLAKRVSYQLNESRILHRADAIHFTSALEAEETYEGDPTLKEVASIILPIPVEVPIVEETAPGTPARFAELASRRKILFMSRFAPQKGLELLMRAFATIKEKYPDWVLVLAGGGDPHYLEQLKQLAGELGIEAAITWTGYLSGSEKWSMLAAADIFVLPSYSESFGIAAAEALVSGCPSILSNRIPFSREAERAGAAYLVSCDTAALTEALILLCNDADKRSDLSARGRLFAQQMFSTKAIGAELLDLYRNVIARHGRVRNGFDEGSHRTDSHA